VNIRCPDTHNVLEVCPKGWSRRGGKRCNGYAILSNATHQSKEMELAEADMQSKLPLFAGKKGLPPRSAHFSLTVIFMWCVIYAVFIPFRWDTCLCF
jgi:hypothetical protein